MNNTSIETIGIFKTVLDPYNGLTISKEDLPLSKEEFELNLDFLLEEIKEKRNLVWIYIDISKSDFIAITTKRGFFFHSCDEDYLLVVKRLVPNAIVPTAANHTLGVGAVVINENKELLVIKERTSTIGYKLPGGHIDTSEMLSKALIREVKEETGIDVIFESIVSLGHFYPHQFHKANLYLVCKAKALNNTIDIQDTKEIEDAKWIDVNTYLSDEKVIKYSKALVLAALNKTGFIEANKDSLAHINRDYELFFANK